MSFHERSARVPLVVAGPGVRKGTVDNACSHLDFLPTLIDIAGGETVDGLDGRSLVPSWSGQVDPVDETFGEYTAEMTSAPIFMIRRGTYKYIHCNTDPAQLYNVAADPLERANLAADPAHAEMAAAFAAEVAERWDSNAIKAQVIDSQRSRHLLHRAMSSGPLVSWDHLPVNDVANNYVRNHQDWAEAGPKMRFPNFQP